MASLKRIDSIEIDQDIEFAQREWQIQRIGWIIIAFLLLAAFLGLFGTGLLTKASVEGEGARLRLDYPRFARVQAPVTLIVQLTPGTAREGRASVWLDSSYLEGVEVQEVTPEPDEVEESGDTLTFHFSIAETEQPARIRFHLNQEQVGLVTGRIGLEGEQGYTFRQLVYP